MKTVEEINQEHMDAGDKIVTGSYGTYHYFLLGTFPEAGAKIALRPRLGFYKQGAQISFKLRLMPDSEAGGEWQTAVNLPWRRSDYERCSGEWGVGIGYKNKDDIILALDEVGFYQTLDNWLTGLGITWDLAQRERLPAYLKDAYAALCGGFDDYVDSESSYVAGGRATHNARVIIPEDAIWEGYQEVSPDMVMDVGAEEDADAFDDGDGDTPPDATF